MLKSVALTFCVVCTIPLCKKIFISHIRQCAAAAQNKNKNIINSKKLQKSSNFQWKWNYYGETISVSQCIYTNDFFPFALNAFYMLCIHPVFSFPLSIPPLNFGVSVHCQKFSKIIIGLAQCLYQLVQSVTNFRLLTLEIVVAVLVYTLRSCI